MDKRITLKGWDGGDIALDLPIYYVAHETMYFGFRALKSGRIRRIYYDTHAQEISVKDLADLHPLDQEDISKLIALCKGFRIIQEVEFIQKLEQIISLVKS